MKKFLMTALFLVSCTNAFSASITMRSTDQEFLKNAANVDFVQYIKGQDQDVKIFSVSGGDPAMNGAHLNLAVFADMQTGWNVFELANVRDFKLLPSSKKGFLKISLLRDTFNPAGDIIQEKSILFINLKNSEAGSIETEEIK